MTGESAITDLLSATVIAPTAAEADALGTMCMSLGLERAKQVISDLEGVDAYLISVATEGSESDFNVWYPPAMEQLIQR